MLGFSPKKILAKKFSYLISTSPWHVPLQETPYTGAILVLDAQEVRGGEERRLDPPRRTRHLDDTTFIYPDEFLELFVKGISSDREPCLVQLL